MPTSVATIQIEATASHVYRYLSTPHLLSEWVEGLTPDSIVGGASELKFGLRSPDNSQSSSIGTGAEDSPITGFKPDHSVSMRLESAGMIMHVRFHLFESEGSTIVRQSVKFSYKRWYRLFAVVTNRSVQKRIDRDLQRLKARVEHDVRSDDLESAA